MRCYRSLLNTSYKDHVTNEEVRNRIQNAVGVHDDLLSTVKKWKLRWYGHISRSSGMAKTILQGTVKGARRRRRQKKRWEDNFKEWIGMEIPWGQRKKGRVDKYCCHVTCGAPTTSEVKGLRRDEMYINDMLRGTCFMAVCFQIGLDYCSILIYNYRNDPMFSDR